MNLGKCARGSIGKRRRRIRPCPPTSQICKIPLRTSFRYLGIDLVLQRVAIKMVAERRMTAFKARCTVVRRLPRQQRGIGVADAVAALWPDGGFAYNKTQIDKAVSAGFVALAGNAKPGTLQRRSRPMTHVLGPGLHYTHLGVASAYCCLRQCLRMNLAGRLKPADWALLWARRSFPFAGPTAQFCKALGSLNIHWISATRISVSGRTLSFDPGDELVTRASIGAVTSLMGSKKIQCILHEAIAFFR